MKVKSVTNTVRCESCGAEQLDESRFRKPHGHTMIVVSIWDEEKKERTYKDFCSMWCLSKRAKQTWLTETNARALTRF